MRQVLDELSQERDREVLIRFYIDQVDKERICAELELSSEAFNQVLFRARRRFRKLWEARQTGQDHGSGVM